MGRPPDRGFIGTLCVTLVLSLVVTCPAWTADWPYAQHDMGATARSTGIGAISDDAGELPGQSFTLRLDDIALGHVELLDINGDGLADVVTAMQGHITAFSGDGGGVLWSTPFIQATGLVGVFDLDGDGVAAEMVGVAYGFTGGIFVVNVDTGGLLWDYGPLTDRSGVRDTEVRAADLDGDGAIELVFAESASNQDSVYVADFSLGLALADVLETTLPAAYTNYNPPTLGDLWGSGQDGGILWQQYGDLAAMEVCSSADPSAVCAPQDSICVCDRGVFNGVYPGFSYGPAWSQDVDGDGVDEVIDIRDDSRYGTQVSVLNVAAGMASGSPVADDLFLWSYNYGYSPPETYVLATEDEAQDLDGDGDLDLLITFYDNTTDEVDAQGQPADDGINLADGFAVGVFDLTTGELVATLPEALAWGTGDFDGDGTAEILTSPTNGWAYLDGLAGYTLDCDNGCEMQLVWEEPNHSLVRDLLLLDGSEFPDIEIRHADFDQNGVPEILAWDGGTLDLLEVAGAAVSITATLVAAAEEEIHAVNAAGTNVLLSTDDSTRLLTANLIELATDIVTEGQATTEVLLVQFDPGNPTATIVADGAVFWSDLTPSGMGDADIQGQPHALFAQDLTGDGYKELVTMALPDESASGSLVIEVISYDPTDPDGDGTPLGVLWTFDGSMSDHLTGFSVSGNNGHLARPADWDGDGELELVFVLFASATYESSFLVLDGQTGAVTDILDASFVPSSERINYHVPLWVEDVVDYAGTTGADGRDDLVVSEQQIFYLIPGGASVATASFDTSNDQIEGLFADLDGDGITEVVVLKGPPSAPEAAAGQINAGMSDFWGTAVVLDGQENQSDETLATLVKDGSPGVDLASATGSGTLEVREGVDGSLATGYPVYLWDGELQTTEAPEAPPLGSIAVHDIDGDGFDEVLAGGGDGFLYAVDVHESEVAQPTLLWSFYVGTPIEQIRLGDVDGDLLDEIVLGGPDSTIRVIDRSGAWIEIESPEELVCLPSTTFTVSGVSAEVDLVDVVVAGTLEAIDVPVSQDEWEAPDVTVAGAGTWSVEAMGKDSSGQVLVYDEIQVLVDGDADGDGSTVCGGDCDDNDPYLNLRDDDADGYSTCDGDCDDGDAGLNLDDADGDGYTTCDGDCDDTEDSIYPGAEEICDDGVDQNCDGFDDEDCYYQDDDDDGEIGGGCECSSTVDGRPDSALWIVGALVLALRRRARAFRRPA